MSERKIELLHDDPATEDEFGTHIKVANILYDQIQRSDRGRAVGLLGDWGSGKSTVINLLRNEFCSRSDKTSKGYIFVYDAWAHEGDQLRRSFLSDLVDFFGPSGIKKLNDKQTKKLQNRIWKEEEHTISFSRPMLGLQSAWVLFLLLLVPIGLVGLSQSDVPNSFLILISVLGPALIFLGLLWATGRHWFGKDSNDPLKFMQEILGRGEGSYETEKHRTADKSATEFKQKFSEIVEAAKLKKKEKFVLVIDNVDRLSAQQALSFWSTLSIFFSDAKQRKPASLKNFWLIVPFTAEALAALLGIGLNTNAIKKTDDALQNKTSLDDWPNRFGENVTKQFDFLLHVPPLILTNRDKYLAKLLKQAIPNLGERQLERLSNILEFSTGKFRAPRQIKTFVNELAVNWASRGDHISIEVHALYVLQRDFAKSQNSLEPPGLNISPYAKSIAASNDLDRELGALQYGVSVEDAGQLILSEPLSVALEIGDMNDILNDIPGRVDLLEQYVEIPRFKEELAKHVIVRLPGQQDASHRIVFLVHFLSAMRTKYDADPGRETWKIIASRTPKFTNWGKYLQDLPKVIEAIIEGCHEDDCKIFVSKMWTLLSSPNFIVTKEEDSDENAQGYLNSALTLLANLSEEDKHLLMLPANPGFANRVLDMVAADEFEKPVNLEAAVVSADNQKSFCTWLLEGETTTKELLTRPEYFLQAQSSVWQVSEWEDFVDRIADRIREAQEGEKLGNHFLLLATIAIERQDSLVSAILEELADEEYVLLHLHLEQPADNSNEEALSLLVALCLAFPPYGVSVAKLSLAPEGASYFQDSLESLLQSNNFTDLVSRWFRDLFGFEGLLKAGFKEPDLRAAVIKILGHAKESSHLNKITIDVGLISGPTEFWIQLFDEGSKGLLWHIFEISENQDEICDALLSLEISHENTVLFAPALIRFENKQSGRIETWLRTQLSHLDSGIWTTDLDIELGAHNSILWIAKSLMADAPLDFGNAAATALNKSMTDYLQGVREPDDDYIESFQVLYNALSSDLRIGHEKTWLENVSQHLENDGNIEMAMPILRLLYGLDSPAFETADNARYFLRQVATRILRKPTQESLQWTTDILVFGHTPYSKGRKSDREPLRSLLKEMKDNDNFPPGFESLYADLIKNLKI